jgi:hypothetical protein
MAAPRYFQTEDEKRMAAIRANPSGKPTQMVRPMLPSNYDAREKWRENAGGKMIGMDQYLENNRKMYTMENVPTAARIPAPKEQMTSEDRQMAILGKYGGAQPVQGSDNRPSGVYEKGKLVESDNRSPGVYDEKGERISPYRPPVAPTSNWQQDITKRFPNIGKEGTPENKEFVRAYKKDQVLGLTEDPMMKAELINETYRPGTFGATLVDDNSAPTAPTPQDIAEMEKAGTADMSPRFSPIEMRGSTLNAWQSGALESPIARKDPYATMLNDRPGGGRTYESFSKPMGSGTLSQRPTSTASGASERVAARRAIRMNPKSTEVARRFARGIGGARNNDSWAP